jgi:hypothetical protein
VIRLLVALDPAEADMLAELAASELCDPRDQLRYVLRQELERRGLLPDENASQPQGESQGREATQ